MTLSHSSLESPSLESDSRRAIESHGEPEYALDQGTREMRRMEHTGVELTAVELAYLKKITADRIKNLEASISQTETSLSEGTAPNSRNAEEELEKARHELDFLQNNLAEKLFEKIQVSSEKAV